MLKRFAALTKKIKDIMELLGKKDLTKEDDAMFTKKHLGPSTCASCDRNLVNINGQPIDFHVWKNMPAREQTANISHISRYGKGFSKILQTMRTPNETQKSISP